MMYKITFEKTFQSDLKRTDTKWSIYCKCYEGFICLASSIQVHGFAIMLVRPIPKLYLSTIFSETLITGKGSINF